MKLSTFLIIATVAYGLHGLGGLIAPAQLFALWGITLDASGQLLARTGSATIGGMAVIFWLTRNTENSPGLRAILLGNAVYLFVEAMVLVIGTLSGIMGNAGWGGVVVDLLLGIGCVYYYAQLARVSTAS